MNMRELSEASGVKYGWIRQVVAGGIARPDAGNLKRIAGPLGIPPDELLALSDQLGEAAPQGLPTHSAVDADMLAQLVIAQTQALVDLHETFAQAREDAAADRRTMMDVVARLQTRLEQLLEREDIGGGTSDPASTRQ